MTAGWSRRGAAGAAGAAERWRAALAAIGKRGRYCEMGGNECAGEGQPHHPGPHDGRARQRCLDRKRVRSLLRGIVAQAGRAYQLIHRCIRPHQLHRRRARLPEVKLLVLIAPVDGTPLPPTAESKVGCRSSASSWGERYRWIDSRAIRQMSYFVVGQEANVETLRAAAGGGAVGDQRRDTISTAAG